MLSYNKFFLAALVTLISPRSAAGLTPYSQFFPNRGTGLTGLINGNCSTQYEAFRNGTGADFDPKYRHWGQNDPGWAVTDCLLSGAPESVKADFSSAQVLLGLTPAVLGVLGPSSQELSLLLVLGNRQLLALFLALGSPFTNTVHSFDFAQEIKNLPRFNGEGTPYVYFEWQAGVPFLYFEYLAALAAIVNIAELSYEFAKLASSTIVKKDPNYLPGLIAILGFAMHLLVAFAFQLCATIKDSSTDERSQPHALNPSGFRRWIVQQLLSIHEDRSRYVELNTAKIPYTITSWFAKIAIFTHFGLSILAFSTVLFVSSVDAVVLFFRYFASVCVCRIVAANEIAVLGMIMNRTAKDQIPRVPIHMLRGGKGTAYDRINDGDDIPLVNRGSGEVVR